MTLEQKLKKGQEIMVQKLAEIEKKKSKIHEGMLVTVWPRDFESPILVLLVKEDHSVGLNDYFCLINEKLCSINIGEIFLDGEIPVKSYANYAMPLLRRIFPSLVAPSIVSIQPITAPVGSIFFK